MIIRLKVFEQTLSIVNTKSVPRKGSKDYLALQFLFSSDWKDLNKVCYLQHGEVSQPIDVVDGLVEVPEWFAEQDSFDVTLFGKTETKKFRQTLCPCGWRSPTPFGGRTRRSRSPVGWRK